MKSYNMNCLHNIRKDAILLSPVSAPVANVGVLSQKTLAFIDSSIKKSLLSVNAKRILDYAIGAETGTFSPKTSFENIDSRLIRFTTSQCMKPVKTPKIKKAPITVC